MKERKDYVWVIENQHLDGVWEVAKTAEREFDLYNTKKAAQAGIKWHQINDPEGLKFRTVKYRRVPQGPGNCF